MEENTKYFLKCNIITGWFLPMTKLYSFCVHFHLTVWIQNAPGLPPGHPRHFLSVGVYQKACCVVSVLWILSSYPPAFYCNLIQLRKCGTKLSPNILSSLPLFSLQNGNTSEYSFGGVQSHPVDTDLSGYLQSAASSDQQLHCFHMDSFFDRTFNLLLKIRSIIRFIWYGETSVHI